MHDNKQEFVTVNNLKRFLQNSDERFAPNKNMEGIKSDGAEGYIAGKAGLVPAPSSSSNGKFLRSDGTWAAPEVPTKVSELDNDSNFLTSSDLSAHTSNENIHVTPTEKTNWNNKQDALTTQQINNINAVPDKANASDLTSHTDDTNIHVTTTEKTTWTNKANKATTLSGYGITDAYTKTQVDKKVSDLVNGAPETLDTLNELASALGNDPNFATTVANQIGTKANNSDVVHKSGDETIVGTKTFSSNLYLKMPNLESNTTTPTSAQYKHIIVVANNDSQLGSLQFSKRADGSFDTTIYSHGGSNDNNNGTLRITSNNEVYSLKSISKLGTSEVKWSEVWAKTFNGNLVTSQINVSNNSSLLRIFGGTSASTGANLDLYGQDKSDNRGSFIMRARDSSGYKALIGKIDGSLTWNSNEILTRVNGVTLDTAQTITGAKTFTPWTTFSNGINVKWITGNKEQKTLSLYGSMNDKYQGFGSTLELHGDDANYGMFSLIAKDKTNTNVKRFIGLPDGTLTWGGKNMARSINGYVADTNGNIAYNIGNDLYTLNADTAIGSIRLFVYRGGGPLTAMNITSGGNLSLISIAISAYDESVETQYGMYSIVDLSTMPGTWKNIGPTVTYGCSSLFIRVA